MPHGSAQRTRQSWAMPAAVVAVVAVLLAVVMALDGESDTDGQAASADAADAPVDVQGPEQPDLTSAERRQDSDPLATGPVDAPVALVVFSDYQCPYCAKWSDETLPLMMEHVEAGDLRVEWRDVNVFGEASERASRASYAAALQGEFWTYHHALFPDGEPRSESDLSADALTDLAGELGLDVAQFTTDFESEQTAEEVTRNAQLGLDLGAHSTPAFILGGTPMLGAQPSEVFLDAFDAALAEAG